MSPPFSCPVLVRSLLLAALLFLLPVRRSVAEDRVDLTLGYYLEDHQRVEVWSPALLWETDINRNTVLRLQGVYDVVSGASPTGAPPLRKTRTETKEVLTAQSSVVTSYNVISGPTGFPGTIVPVTSTVTTTKKVKQTVIVPYGKPFLPVQTFDDERLGLNLELEHHQGDWIYTGSLAYGNESDYESLAATLKLSRELNHKDTVLSLGASAGRDWVLNPAAQEWDDKDVVEGLASVSQVINAKTLLTLSGTLGTSWGYLDDQYKYASVNDLIVHEKRPQARDRRIAMLMLNRTFDSIHGSVEATYRYYDDSYGIGAHTFGLTWFQHIGRWLVVAPDVRYYEQSAADFYAVKFNGRPAIFSSDYRLSKLASFTYGLKVVVNLARQCSFSLAYDRYSMWGRDGQTSREAYPSASIFTAGVQLWY